MSRDFTRVLDVLAGDPLPGADQHVPGLFPHVAQVHGVDPVGYPARAPQVLPFDARGGLAGLLLPGLVARPDHQAAAPVTSPRRFLQPGHREPAHHAHRGERVPAHVIEQSLGPIRRLVPGMAGDARPVPLRQLAHHRRRVLAQSRAVIQDGSSRSGGCGQHADVGLKDAPERRRPPCANWPRQSGHVDDRGQAQAAGGGARRARPQSGSGQAAHVIASKLG